MTRTPAFGCPKPEPRKKPRKPLKRTRLKSRGPRTKKSGGRLFYKDRAPELLEAVRTLPCAFCLASGRRQRDKTEPEHLKTRGSSGKEWNNVIPTCGFHRNERDVIGPKTMWAKYRKHGLDVWDLAREVTAMYRAGTLAAA